MKKRNPPLLLVVHACRTCAVILAVHPHGVGAVESPACEQCRQWGRAGRPKSYRYQREEVSDVR